jgi:hypothetical protein
MPEKDSNAKMSEVESTADETKKLSEDARDRGPRQEGLVRIGVATMRTWAGDALKMADVDANKQTSKQANKQRYEPWGAAGHWVYKFDRLRADDSPVHSLPEHEGDVGRARGRNVRACGRDEGTRLRRERRRGISNLQRRHGGGLVLQQRRRVHGVHRRAHGRHQGVRIPPGGRMTKAEVPSAAYGRVGDSIWRRK